MEKKLLVLFLAFGLAALANAELMYQVDGVNYAAGSKIFKMGTFTIGIVNINDPIQVPSIGGVKTTGVFTAGSAVINDDNLPGIWVADDTYIDTYSVYQTFMQAPAVTPIDVGMLFSYEITVGMGDSFSLVDEQWNESSELGAVFWIPEPATMTLLGLGGLLLRRRKFVITRTR